MNTSIDDAEEEGWPITNRTNIVHGPTGFTESFDDHTVDLLCRMGLIKWERTTSALGWETKVYRAPHLIRKD